MKNPQVDRSLVLRVAGACEPIADPRTVAKYLAGRGVNSHSASTIAAALRRLRIADPRPAALVELAAAQVEPSGGGAP